ncbi:MAG: redoxin domain-containing protein [Alistipes sp.]|nr:redoxin domain-containing protein [Alistipes sp.]
MKKGFIWLALLLMVGCVKTEVESALVPQTDGPTFHAAFAEEATRTFLDEHGKMHWTNDDRVTIFWGDDNNREYAFTGETGALSGDFRQVALNPNGVGEMMWANYALYPHSSETRFVSTGPSGYLKCTLPATQYYAEGSFGPEANTMVAVTESLEDRYLQFKNVCGYIKLNLYGDDVTVKQITLQENGGGVLAGAVRVEPMYGREPSFSWEFTDMSEVLTLDCGAGVKLGTSEEHATSFIFVVPPKTFYAGFSITVTDVTGKTFTKQTTLEQVITRNVMKSMPAVKVTTKDVGQALANERKALIALYQAMGGDQWTNNSNWCSGLPISEWYGLGVNEEGFVTYISLSNNNVVGEIPEAINTFEYLTSLELHYNYITGMAENVRFPVGLMYLSLGGNAFECEIPEWIGTLTELRALHWGDAGFHGNQRMGLVGSIPASIGNLTNLEQLSLDWNRLTGEIPESLGNLKKLQSIILNANILYGNMPASVMQLDCWPMWWFWIVNQDCRSNNGVGISKESLVIPAPKFTEITSEGETLDYSIYAENEYTVLYHYFDWCVHSNDFTPKLAQLYEGYKDKGLAVLAFSDEGSVSSYQNYATNFMTSWPYLVLSETSRNLFYSYIGASPNVCVVDKSGYVIFNHNYDNYEDLDDFLLERLGAPNEGGGTTNFYESSDYSRDGEVKQLQHAAKGKGIDIVLMGDGYTDRLIADGTYDRVMNTAMESFFMEEPYKSFRDHFNVYAVTAVSKNGLYAENSSTKFEGWFGEKTAVGGNDETVFTYAQKALSDERVDEALIVVMMNSEMYAGTCYMYGTLDDQSDWGNGVSISYFPVGVDDEALAQVMHHEAGGHGFAKLGDEYAYAENGRIPADAVEYHKSLMQLGWLKNIDFTNDKSTVKWSHFLQDSRYLYDGLYVYEGGLTYWSGVWRPTEYSIMRYNTGGFNAPSREAIYYRIHKLAYGADWQYDYEQFVEWDARNRKGRNDPAVTRGGVPYKMYEPTPSPVIYTKSWRDLR